MGKDIENIEIIKEIKREESDRLVYIKIQNLLNFWKEIQEIVKNRFFGEWDGEVRDGGGFFFIVFF